MAMTVSEAEELEALVHKQVATLESLAGHVKGGNMDALEEMVTVADKISSNCGTLYEFTHQ